jgi:hypothetical protein
MTTMSDNTLAQWHYVHNGDRIGPVSHQEMERLVKQGRVSAATSVWSGEGDWHPAGQDPALSSLFQPTAGTPPPLQGTDVDNRLAWGIAAVPLAGMVLELIAGSPLTWVYLAANIVLCVLDERRLKAAGHQSPSSWWCLLIPVYLWKRSGLLGQSRKIFWCWLAAFMLSITLGSGGQQAALEKAAVPVVTQILEEGAMQQNVNSFLSGNGMAPAAHGAKCKAVQIVDEPTAGFYRAKAVLDNGGEIQISIEEQGDKILVKTLPDQ